MAYEDEGRWEDRFGLVLDHKAVTLELPHLGRDGIHLMESVAGKKRKSSWSSQGQTRHHFKVMPR